MTLCRSTQELPNWLAEMQITNLDVSFCKACKIDVVSRMTSLSVLSLQVNGTYHLCRVSVARILMPPACGRRPSGKHWDAFAKCCSMS